MAHQIADFYWDSIAAIAERLYSRQILFSADIRECVRAAGDACLLREQPPVAVMPARPTLHSARLWGFELRDAGDHADYLIDRTSRRAYYDNIVDAVRAAALMVSKTRTGRVAEAPPSARSYLNSETSNWHCYHRPKSSDLGCPLPRAIAGSPKG
jgi:hypothetical protein